MLENVTKTIKDLKGLIASIIAILAIVGFSPAELRDVFVWYNGHIAIMYSIGFYITYRVSTTGHKKLELGLLDNRANINKIFKKMEIDQLKARIEQTYRDYKNVDVIDFKTSIDLIYGLEEERKIAGLNSHHQRSLDSLIGRIKE